MVALTPALRRWRLPASTALLLWASTPPALLPGGGLLVLPAWMLCYALATAAPRRPLRQFYLLGVAHMLLFSWSLHHVLWLGWLLIGLVGGGYYALLAWSTRKLLPLSGPLAFGLSLAAVHWLRANMPEIYYPHGQPVHALWQQPWLCGPVGFGGEALGNLLLGALAAALVDLWRSWRLAALPWRGARGRAAAVAGLWLLLAVLPPPAAAAAAPAQVDVAAIESGMHPLDPYHGLTRGEAIRRFDELLRQRLVQPTLELAGPRAASPPDLVLWPESSIPVEALDPAAPARFQAYLRGVGLRLAPGVRLCLGAAVNRQGEERDTPAALLFDAGARFLAHQEKLALVPAGETPPFLSLLPESWAAAVRSYVKAMMGSLPDSAPGQPMPPLRTAAGVSFGTLMCYDNAFPELAAAQVAAGARLLCVLSNEAWYRGGGELQQLVAMSVMRALETRTPLVRCTTDGWSVVVGADGRIAASLPPSPAPAAAARALRFSVACGPGALPPLAWLRPLFAAAAAGALGLGILHSLWRWARLPAVRAKPAPAEFGRSPNDPGTGGS